MAQPVKIIGAGMAGLLAGRMLAAHRPEIVEAQPALPNNHSAVLRFRTPVVQEATGIPFRRVTVVKTTATWRNPVADALAYSMKVIGTRQTDRSILRGTETAERYIAPPDFIQQLAGPSNITYGTPYAFQAPTPGPIISTLPMPTLMAALDYPHVPKFISREGVNIRFTLSHTDAYVSVAVPDPMRAYSRISITGDEAIVEVPNARIISPGTIAYFDHEAVLTSVKADAIVEEVHEYLGLGTGSIIGGPELSSQRYAKIAPIDEQVRKEFIFWATTHHNIYSLGRYATWRPGLLLDDLVQDVRKIEQWIARKGDNYGRALS